MAAVIVTKAWLSVPLFMAFFLAGLQGVSQDQVDAARVDGCENLGVLRYVVLPHMAPTMIIVTILGAMGNLQAFDVIYALTQGGPIKATTMLSVEVYKQAFQNWDMGTACAVGVLWFVTIAIPTSSSTCESFSAASRLSATGRPEREYRSAQHEGSPVNATGRTEREYRSAQHEGSPASPKGHPGRECR